MGYFSDNRSEWASRILEIGGPIQMMWDSFRDEAIERAMLFGRSGDNWLAVRPNRRVSDGRPATEIRCWLSKDR